MLTVGFEPTCHQTNLSTAYQAEGIRQHWRAGKEFNLPPPVFTLAVLMQITPHAHEGKVATSGLVPIPTVPVCVEGFEPPIS